MAYGLKYYFSFQDEWSRFHHIQILKDGYSGTTTELTKVGMPPVIITKPSDGFKFQPIQGKEIALRLISDSDMKFSEFFTVTNREYLIRYWIENSSNSDLVTNGNFANWTGDDPDDWDLEFAEDANSYITESSAKARFVNEGGIPPDVKISQTILTAGNCYIAKVDCTNATDGALQIYGLNTISIDYHLINSVNSFKYVINAQQTKLFIQQKSTATDITIDNVICKAMDKIFEGYLTPDMYYEPFTAPTYEVTLRGTDGLGDLKNVKFESAVDTPYTGQDDLLDVIEKCLDGTGLALDIYSACNIFCTGMNTTDADDPLPQSYINQEVYREDLITAWNCYDVLYDIMTCFGAKLEQINGAWHIIPLRNLADTSYDRRKYDSDGTYQSNDSESPQLTISAKDAAEASLCAWNGNEQMLEIISGWKEFTVLQNLGYLENILENGNFYRDFWNAANDPMSWSKTDNTFILRSEDGAELTGVNNVWANAKKIWQTIDYYVGNAGYLVFDLDYIIQCPGADAASLVIKIIANGAPDYVTADGTFSAVDTAIIVDSCGANSVVNGTYKIITDIIPAVAGTKLIEVYIAQPWDANDSGQKIIIKEAKLNIIKSAGGVYEKENKIKTSINTNYQYKPENINVNIGGVLYGGYDEETVYKGFLINSSTGRGWLSGQWFHKGGADTDDLLDHTAADIENNYDNPTYKLRGTIHSKVMDFNTTLKETNLSNKLFIPGQMSYNPKKGLWSGEWLEIVTN